MASEATSDTAPADPPAGADGTERTADHGQEGSRTQARRAAADAETTAPVRVDAWIWSVRLVKSRSLAATACRGGHVRVNGERVKPAYQVRPGDEVRLRHAGRERIVVVRRVIRKRVGAPVAVECYVDNSPPPPPREAVAPAGVRDRGTGRPTKRDRREMERLVRGGSLGASSRATSAGGDR
jgi:ribosome-associated heat shock protein Hsp15